MAAQTWLSQIQYECLALLKTQKPTECCYLESRRSCRSPRHDAKQALFDAMF